MPDNKIQKPKKQLYRESISQMEQEPILTQPIDSFQMSVEFDKMCIENGFSTFGDILLHDTPQLLNKPGFNYRMLREFYGFLAAIDKGHLLRD